jgi:hypothetical protein
MVEDEDVKDFLSKAQDALGMDIGELLAEIGKTNAEDQAFRQEVLKRFDVLLDNQRLIYARLKGLQGDEE